MRIKEINIENFGKLSNYNLKLDDKTTAVFQDNGWGKSTIASFIKVMFFGFDNEEAKKDVEIKRERKRFSPWDGGTYGGSIVFEAKGKEYRLTRIFKDNRKEDQFSLYDNKTNLESSDFTENIGIELFGLDAESFKKTILISQNEIGTSSTDGINANLANLTGATDDIDNFEEVIEKFRVKLNNISEKRTTGDIYKLKNEVTGLENEIKRLPSVESSITDKAKKLAEERTLLAEKEDVLKSLQSELTVASKNAELLSKKDQYEGILKKESERKEAEENAKKAFPSVIPDEKELTDYISKAKKASECAKAVMQYALSEDESKNLSRLDKAFAKGIPSDSDIDSHIQDVARLDDMEKEFARLQFSEEEKADYEVLSTKYEGKAIDESNISQLSSRFSDAQIKKGGLSAKEALLASLKYTPKKNENTSALWIILLAIGAVLICGGIALLGIVSKGLGIGVIILGAAALALGIALKVLKKAPKESASENNAFENLEAEIKDEKRQIAEAEDAVKDFFINLNIQFDLASATSLLIEIGNEYRRYKSLVDKKLDQRDDTLAEEIRMLRENLEQFLAPYSDLFTAVSDYNVKLNELRHEARTYSKLLEQKREHDDAEKELRTESEPVASFIKSLGFTAEDGKLVEILSEINAKLSVYNHAKNELDSIKKEKDSFEAANSITDVLEAKTEGIRSVDEINKDLSDENAKHKEIFRYVSEYNNQLEKLEAERDELSEKESELSVKREALDNLRKRRDLISKTKDLLEVAKTNFTAKYSKPVSDGFKKYYELIDGTDGHEYTFDANMDLKIMDHGDYKNIILYSAGSQDKIGLCFRLGLIEAMYKDEKPIIIMDDPFTNLDQTHLDGGKKLLKELEKEYQVLYLTCHESRMPS